MITNPVAYYEAMGFISVDSLVYSASLIGALGGIAGTVKGLMSGDMRQGLIFAALAGASFLSAMEGLKIANAGSSVEY